MSAEVTRLGIFDMQVCVPTEWTDSQVEEFANNKHPAGTDHGWKLRDVADPAQAGMPVRVPCSMDDGQVHVMLSC